MNQPTAKRLQIVVKRKLSDKQLICLEAQKRTFRIEPSDKSESAQYQRELSSLREVRRQKLTKR